MRCKPQLKQMNDYKNIKNQKNNHKVTRKFNNKNDINFIIIKLIIFSLIVFTLIHFSFF